MQIDEKTLQKLLSKDFLDVMIRVGLIAFLIIMCVRIFAPFTAIMLWALILAVALYPLHQNLASRTGGKQGRAATLIVLIGLLIIGVPTLILGSSFAGHIHDLYSAFANNEITIKQPGPQIAEWPLIGERLFNAWSAAAQDLPAFLEKLQPQLGKFTKYMLSLAASTAGALFMFLGALIVSGIMMAYGQSGSEAMKRIIIRLATPAKGPHLYRLITATIRSVATGVIGVAFIQALLLGIGFLLAGIPAAGVLALIALLIGIMQLPATIISIPAIIYLWWIGDGSTVGNIIFTVYLIVAGLVDNVLKPLLLGRGVDAPMPVILLGALGGMVSGGIIGLFVGAVVLAVGYQIFMDWVNDGSVEQAADDGAAAPSVPVGD